MSKLQYERIGQIVVISSLKKEANVLSILDITKPELELTFLDYVKSQVHLFFHLILM